MRLVSLLFILILSASCGQDGGKKSSASSSTTGGDGVCSLNGRAVACQSIRGADGLGIDLLESVIDVPVKIENSEITFLSDKAATSSGRRISCNTSVKKGEIYRYALRGHRLLITTSECGSYEMDRLSDGEGISGSWVWKGYIDEGTHLIRNMTFVGDSRVVMRSNCEL